MNSQLSVAITRLMNRYFSITGIGMLALAVILAYFPLYNLFVDGPFHWQIHPARFKQGGIEALVFAAAMAGACLFARTMLLRGLALCVLGLLYLRLHYVDLPLVCSLLYVEAIMASGRLLVQGFRRSGEGEHGFMLHLLCGIGAYSVLIALLSAVHLAYPGVLYGTVLGIGLLAALITRHVPYLYLAVRNGVSGAWVERVVFALLCMTVLVMAAKTNLINDYDSAWYGLRSAYVLEQGGSIFANLGLAHFVFYYPKLYEALILPLCAFPDPSYPAALNIAFYALTLYVVRDMVVGVTGDRALASLVTLVVAWVPVAIFTALLVKPDLLTGLLLLIAARCLMRFVIGLMLGDALVGAGALAMALCVKLTTIPFGGLMFIASMIVLGVCVFRAMSKRGDWPVVAASMPQSTAFMLGLVTFAVFTWRTYSITGLPYVAPDFLRKLFESLGFVPHFPYADFTAIVIGGSWHFDWQSFAILYDALMQPAELGHIVFSWISNVFVLTALIAIFSFDAWRKHREFSRPFLVLCVPLFLLTLVFITFLGKVHGGDGNYYVFPIIFFTALSAASLRYAQPVFRAWAIAALLLTTASNCYAWFGTTPQWYGGTAPYSADLLKSTFDNAPVQESELKDNGLAKIAAVLDQASRSGHCTALADGDEFTLFKLPCAVESAHTVAGLRSPHFADTHALSAYIAQAKFDFLLVPDVPQTTLLSKVFAEYARLPGVVRMDDGLYNALDLRGVTEPLPVLSAQVAEEQPLQEPLLLVKYLQGLKAQYPAQPVDATRPPFNAADIHLKEYLGSNALVLRTGTSLQASSDVIPFACPGVFSFDLGLLPPDQLAGVGDAVLSVSWSDGQGGRTLGTLDLKAPSRGFQHQDVSIVKCGKQVTTLVLRASRAPDAQYASMVMVDPLLHR